MLVFIILSSLVNATISHYYEINLKYKNGDIILKSIQVKPLIDQKDLQNIEGGYIAEVISFDNEVLNLTFFDIPTTIIYDNFDPETGEAIGGGVIELNETEVTIKFPYFENAKEINIYDNNITKKLTIDISDYAKNKITQQEAAKEIQQKEKQIMPKIVIEKKGYYTIYLLFLLFIIMLIMVYLYKRKK